MTGLGYTPDPELLRALREADKARDRALWALVADELSWMLPGYQQREDEAGEEFRAAVLALEEPGRVLSGAERQKAEAEAEAAAKREQLESPDFSTRMAVRGWLAEYASEAVALDGKLRQMTDAIVPLRQARDRARARLDDAFRERKGLEDTIADPPLAFLYFGPKTAVYQTFRFGTALDDALSRGHPERAQAEAHMDWLSVRHAYRTDGSAGREKLPDAAERQRDYWDSVAAAASRPWAPRTGQEVVAAMHRRYESAALAKEAESTASRIEDYRGRPGPVRIPMR
jgi:hypothetical protein